MGDFFKGWRRKAGCVTLALAIVFTGAWLRSLICVDTFRVFSDRSVQHLVSSETIYDESHIYYLASSDRNGMTLEAHVDRSRKELESLDPGFRSHEEWPLIDGIATFQDFVYSHWQLAGASYKDVATLREDSDHGHLKRVLSVVIPYWAITIPLTLVSAYLILWMPRKRVDLIFNS